MNAIVAQETAIRPMQEQDLAAADRIMRLAFGTFLGLPDPGTFMGDADYIQTRWRANPAAAFSAEVGARVIGSNFASNWGSVGFFGPLSIHPEMWDSGAGKRLMEPVVDCFNKWGTVCAGLFTFSQSAKHVGLYQKFGFWPRFLTAVMSRPVAGTATAFGWTRFSKASALEQEAHLRDCTEVTDAIYSGLEVGADIHAVATQSLGDTVLLWDDGILAGFAICHCGPRTEAGSGACYIKFGAVRPGASAERNFERLISACEALAASLNLARLVAGVNTARHEAYRTLLASGFRTELQGVAMQRHNEPGYNRPGVYLIDDWR